MIEKKKYAQAKAYARNKIYVAYVRYTIGYTELEKETANQYKRSSNKKNPSTHTHTSTPIISVKEIIERQKYNEAMKKRIKR